jgi:tetratricopeptide (TPR) repeat protein
MSTLNVPRLADYRSGRAKRSEQIAALYRGDPARSCLLGHLASAQELLGADRAAIVWLDEYGPGLVHVHCLLDLVGNPPRRNFTAQACRVAWSKGVPGLLDVPDAERTKEIPISGVRSSCCVAMGSDGTRTWFLIVDSLTPRSRLTVDVTDDLMFLAGEAAAVVLHQDMDRKAAGTKRSHTSAMPEAGETFSGWAILKDLEGREAEDETNRRIATRFLVARAVRSALDEELTMDPEALRQQVEGVRRELDTVDEQDAERRGWSAVLDALADGEGVELGSALLALAESVDMLGHLHGAKELFSLANQVGVTCGSGAVAGDAAHFLGRAHRRLGAWEESEHWCGVAQDMGNALDDGRMSALAANGLGNTAREKGNLPRAIELHRQSLEWGQADGDRFVQGIGHHDLMTDEMRSGRVSSAIRHGWQAVRLYPSERNQVQALTDLAWVFVEAGELGAAEDAYTVVVHRSQDFRYRTYALQALAYIEARLGRREQFESRLKAIDATAWRSGSTFMVSDLLLNRGKAFGLMGDIEAAETWLSEAKAHSEAHGNHQISFQADTALEELRDGKASTEDTCVEPMSLEEIDGVRSELSSMRHELVSSAGTPGF